MISDKKYIIENANNRKVVTCNCFEGINEASFSVERKVTRLINIEVKHGNNETK